MNYTIGLIDEEEAQLTTIRRTIKYNNPSEDNIVEFKEYPLTGGSDRLSEQVTFEVIKDIVNGGINSLIIDYKIMIHTALVEGTAIYKAILDTVPKFPVIILTDVPSSCYEKDFVDADKVYGKKEFFKIEGDYSREKTANIFINMERYVKQRAELSIKLQESLARLSSEGFSAELYKEIIQAEKNLDALFPQGQTQVDKTVDPTELKEAVELLEKADKLLGDNHEIL